MTRSLWNIAIIIISLFLLFQSLTVLKAIATGDEYDEQDDGMNFNEDSEEE